MIIRSLINTEVCRLVKVTVYSLPRVKPTLNFSMATMGEKLSRQFIPQQTSALPYMRQFLILGSKGQGWTEKFTPRS